MSEFLIVKTNDPNQLNIKNILFVPIKSNKFLMNAITDITKTSNFENFYQIIDNTNKTSDLLFTEAQNNIYAGKAFSDTRIFKIVNQAFNNKFKMIMWYSSYYTDLEEFDNKEQFLKYLITALKESCCEVYAII